MTHTRRLGLAALALALVMTAPLAAQDSPLANVPASAPIVIQLHGVERTKDRLVTMVKNALPDFGKVVDEKVEEAFKNGLEGRELKGLAKNGPVFIVFTEMPVSGQDPPNIAIMVKVTDYAAFRDGILKDEERKALKKDPAGFEVTTVDSGKATETYFLEKNGYAIVTPVKEVAVQFTKKFKGLDGKLGKETAKQLLAADVAVYVDMAAINKQFGDQIKQGREQFIQLMEAGQGFGGDKNSIEMIKRMVGPLFQAIEDSRAAVVSIDFRPAGLALHAQVQVGSDTATNTVLKDVKPSALQDLAKLPAGQMAYTGMDLSPALVKSFGTLLLGIPGDPDSKALKDLFDQIAAAKPKAQVGAMDLPPQGIQVWSYEDPAKAADAQLKLLPTLKSGAVFQSGMLKDKPEIKPHDKKHQGFDLHSVRMTFDLEKMIENNPGAQNLPEASKKALVEGMKKLTGESVRYWFGTDGKTFVQVTAKDWAGAQKLLDAYLEGKSTVGAQAAFRDARKELPAEATFLSLIDGPKYVRVIAEFVEPLVAGMLPLPPGVLKPAVEGKTVYMGVAATLQPERASFDLWIPGSFAHEVYKMFVERWVKPNVQ